MAAMEMRFFPAEAVLVVDMARPDIKNDTSGYLEKNRCIRSLFVTNDTHSACFVGLFWSFLFLLLEVDSPVLGFSGSVPLFAIHNSNNPPIIILDYSRSRSRFYSRCFNSQSRKPETPYRLPYPSFCKSSSPILLM